MESSNIKNEDKDNEGNIKYYSCNLIIGAQDVGVYHCTNSGFVSRSKP
jgi:hypothetical protein